jgi:hypothetical protein
MSSKQNEPSSSKDQYDQPSLELLQKNLDKCVMEWDKKHKEQYPKPTALVSPQKRYDSKPMFPKPNDRPDYH